MVTSDRRMRCAVGVGAAVIATLAGSASGQYPWYQLRRVGLFDAPHTAPGGVQQTGVNGVVLAVREVMGFSTRAAGGFDTWVWTPALGHSQVIGLTVLPYTGGGGYRYVEPKAMNQSGQVAGTSQRFKYTNTVVGQDAWVWSAALGGTQLIGLVDATHTDANGDRASEVRGQHHNGFVNGTTTRFAAGGTANGKDAWVWRPGLGTLANGLTGPRFTGSAGYRNETAAQIVNGADLVLGLTDQISGVSTKIGQSLWVWGESIGTVELGLTGSQYVSTTGGGTTVLSVYKETGVLAGRTTVFLGAQQNGWDAWIWTAGNGITPLGLEGPQFTGTNGYRSSTITEITDGGTVVGSTFGITGSSTLNGLCPWVWSEALGGMVRLGLFDADHTSPTGTQDSTTKTIDETETIAGTSKRYSALGADRGADAWGWDPVAVAVVPIGLTDADHVRTDGYRSHTIRVLFPDGRVEGVAKRYTPSDADNGQSVWVWSAELGTTVEIGLTGAEFEGPSGYRYSERFGVADALVVTGYTKKYDGLGNDLGLAAWVWDASIGTVRIGLFDAAHTRGEGRQNSVQTGDTPTGVPYGTSENYAPDGSIGMSAWVADPETGATQRMGLTDGTHSKLGGYSLSAARTSSAASRYLAGESTRFSPGAGAEIGRDAWWFDRQTGVTENAMAGAPDAVRLTDGYAWSTAEYVTDDGVLVGSYLFFENGVGDGVSHLFLYRPDLGFTDLDAVAPAGMAGTNCGELFELTYDAAPDLLVATGMAIGQTNGSSLFVAIPVDCAGDATGDGKADAEDFNVMASHFGETVDPFTNGDLTGDGLVNSSDFNTLAGDFGCGTG